MLSSRLIIDQWQETVVGQKLTVEASRNCTGGSRQEQSRQLHVMHSNCYSNGRKTLFTAQRKALLYYTCVTCTDRWCSPSFRFRGVEYGLVGRLILTFFFFSTGVFFGFSTLVSSPTGSGSVFLSSLVSYQANRFRACLARDKILKLF